MENSSNSVSNNEPVEVNDFPQESVTVPNSVSSKESVKWSEEIDEEEVIDNEDLRSSCSIFPSLEKYSISSDDNVGSEKNLEIQFSSYTLAFKCDQVTLDDRLNLLLRKRDQAEKNVFSELNILRSQLNNLHPFCINSDTTAFLEEIHKQINVIEQATRFASIASEWYGAIQQEKRVSSSVEIMLSYMNSINRRYQKEHVELEETRKTLEERSESNEDNSNGSLDSKSNTLPLTRNTKMISKRRASIAELPRIVATWESVKSSGLKNRSPVTTSYPDIKFLNTNMEKIKEKHGVSEYRNDKDGEEDSNRCSDGSESNHIDDEVSRDEKPEEILSPESKLRKIWFSANTVPRIAALNLMSFIRNNLYTEECLLHIRYGAAAILVLVAIYTLLASSLAS